MSILLVEDDLQLATSITRVLQARYAITCATGYQQAQQLLNHTSFDLLIIDQQLPDGDGLELCRYLRQNNTHIGIIMVTNPLDAQVAAICINAGADDFLAKPFQISELSARVRALLRRSATPMASSVLHVGGLQLDHLTGMVTFNHQLVPLRRKEFLMLSYLMSHAHQIITRERLFEQVWGYDSLSDLHTVDVHIQALRNKIDRRFQVQIITTVYGLGYKLVGRNY